MIRSIRRALARRGDRKLASKDGKRWVRSFMHVFRTFTEGRIPTDEKRLAELIGEGRYCCIGKSHSYNGVQVVPQVTAMIMEEGGLKRMHYDPQTETVHVGASVDIRTLKEYLRDEHGRGLINSGNYMAQTVVGALATGTHGFGPRAVMADHVVAMTFLDEQGQRVRLRRGDPGFAHAVLSFGTIAPIVELEIETVELRPFISTTYLTRLSKVAGLQPGTIASNWAVLPYTNPDDPVTMLHTLAECDRAQLVADKVGRPLSRGWFARWFLKHYKTFDRFFPMVRRPMQRLIDRLDIEQREQIQTDPDDLDYLYDPKPGLSGDRPPSITRGMFSTTFTGYNLAFFVPLEKAQAVVKFILREADGLRDLGFYLKGIVSVRELPGTAGPVFAANAEQPMAAIDLFADPRDYAWLERLQRLVMEYEPETRPHFGKSALGPHFRDVLGVTNIRALMRVYSDHYPSGRLIFEERTRAMLDVGRPMPGSAAREAGLA